MPIITLPLPLRRWYTLCGAKHPQQGTPDCDVESKFYETFRAIEAINPKVTNIICVAPSARHLGIFKAPDRCLYVLAADLNSMFDFAAYNLHGEMMKLEAAGKPAFLRDDRGEVVILCNVRCQRCPPPAAAWQQVPATPDA